MHPLSSSSISKTGVIIIISVLLIQFALSNYMEKAALGRRLRIGQFYDVRTDRMIPGFNLWSSDDIENIRESITVESPKTHHETTYESDLSTFVNFLDVNVRLAIGFFYLIFIEITGAVDYLDIIEKHRDEARMEMITKRTFYFEYLNDEFLRKEPIYSNLTKRLANRATHVVVGVQYGSNYVLKLSFKNNRAYANKSIKGSVSVWAKLVPVILEAGGTLSVKTVANSTDIEKEIRTKFYGDFVLPSDADNPTEVETLRNFFKEQANSSAIGKRNDSVPIRVWLRPLSMFNKELLYEEFEEEHRNDVLFALAEEMQCLNGLRKEADDLRHSRLTLRFPTLERQLRLFAEIWSEYFEALREYTAPRIKNMTEADMTELAQLLFTVQHSGFSCKNNEAWLDTKQNFAPLIAEMLKQKFENRIGFATKPGVGLPSEIEFIYTKASDKEIISDIRFDRVLSLQLRLEEASDQYLEFLQADWAESEKDPSNLRERRFSPSSFDLWHKDARLLNNLTIEMRRFYSHFTTYRNTPTGDTTKYVVYSSPESDYTNVGAAIQLLTFDGSGGAPENVRFVPPGRPRCVRATASGSGEGFVLRWDPPRRNDSVTGYKVTMVDADKFANYSMALDSLSFHVEGNTTSFESGCLEKETRYLVRVSALSEAGVSPAESEQPAEACFSRDVTKCPDVPDGFEAHELKSESRTVSALFKHIMEARHENCAVVD